MVMILGLILLVAAGVVALVLGVAIKAAHALIVLGAVCLLAAFVGAVVKVIK